MKKSTIRLFDTLGVIFGLTVMSITEIWILCAIVMVLPMIIIRTIDEQIECEKYAVRCSKDFIL